MLRASVSGQRRNAQRGGIFFRLLFLIFFLAFLVVLYLVRNPILRLAGSFWIVDETPQVSDVIVGHRAEDTREEAEVVSQAVAAHGWKKVLLVTSNYHTRRADYIFERTLPRGTELRVIAARDMDYDPDNWWRSRMGVKIFLHEAVGYIVAMWEMRHADVQTSWLRIDVPGGRPPAALRV